MRRRVLEGEVISRVEAGRGELISYIKSDGTEKPERAKIRTPTMANLVAVPHMLKGAHIADVPIVVAAIDGEVTVKRFMRNREGISLVPSNPELTEIRVPEGAELRIIGKVVAVLRFLGPNTWRDSGD